MRRTSENTRVGRPAYCSGCSSSRCCSPPSAPAPRRRPARLPGARSPGPGGPPPSPPRARSSPPGHCSPGARRREPRGTSCASTRPALCKLAKTGIAKLSWRCGSALEKNVASTWKVRARNARGAGPWSTSRSFKVALAIGDAYGGGTVAYILQSGDPGYVAGETHGLIAAPADQTPANGEGVAWTNFTDTLIGATAQGVALGTGRPNTAAIVAQTIEDQHCVLGAAYSCDNLVDGELRRLVSAQQGRAPQAVPAVRDVRARERDGNFNPSRPLPVLLELVREPPACSASCSRGTSTSTTTPAPTTTSRTRHFKTQTFSVRAVRSF